MADFKMDRKGIVEILNSSEVGDAVHRLAEQVAADVRGQKPGADVVVDDYTTDRRASSVTIREPQARRWQVRDGVLTRAAAQAGLEVTER